MKTSNLALMIIITFCLLCGCSRDDGLRDIQYVPMAALDRPTNLALSQECLDAWYDFCEYSIFPEKYKNWNYEMITRVQLLINKGCVLEKTQTFDYSNLEEFTSKHEQLYQKYTSELIEWRKKNPAPKTTWKKVSSSIIEHISEEWSCQYAYGESACLEFFLLRSKAQYHRRRAEPWFAKKTFFYPGLHLDEIF